MGGFPLGTLITIFFLFLVSCLAGGIMMGLPALILKGLVLKGCRIDPGERKSILVRAALGAAAAGGIAIFVSIALPQFKDRFALGGISQWEAVTLMTLLGLTALAEIAVWRLGLPDALAKRRLAWVVFGNLWLVLAFFLVSQTANDHFLMRCQRLPELGRSAAEKTDCEAAPRAFWQGQPDLLKSAAAPIVPALPTP